ncbi:MAG: DEAD/DEAH box helicase [Caldilineaceae bacterium]
MSFEQFSFDARIASGIRSVGFTAPTPIQSDAIPHVLAGRDLLGLAQTGTGKTAAFVLPILQRLIKGALRKQRVLILAPTRELAEQIHATIQDLGRHTRIRSMTIYGGVGKQPQVAGLRRGTEIVVACPGRLLDLMNEGVVDLSQIEVLVLDEADRMCDMGFLPDVRRILAKWPTQRQTLFFSATMPDDIRKLAGDILKNPATVQIGMIAPAKTVSHALYPVEQAAKKRLLLAMLDQTPTGRVLVFTRTKYRARSLAEDLAKKGYRAVALQGNMAQTRRQQAIDGFRTGRYDILVATDIASRGIDVTEVSHVINFDIPDTVDAYTHRIGRTGRAEQEGDAFTFVTPDDEAMVRDIERVLGQPLDRRYLADFNYGAPIPAAVEDRRPAPSSRSKRGQSAQTSPNPARAKTAQPKSARTAGKPPERSAVSQEEAGQEKKLRRRRFRRRNSGQGRQG